VFVEFEFGCPNSDEIIPLLSMTFLLGLLQIYALKERDYRYLLIYLFQI
jgi:hypothetical protein